MKIFGNDGFRSKFGEMFMSYEFIEAFAYGISEFCLIGKINSSVIIGRDTRASGKIIENIISSVINYRGLDVNIAGVISTPGFSSIIENGKFSIGIMITASHNPASDNGIKLFNCDGFKLDNISEKYIEKYIISYLNNRSIIYKKEIGKIKRLKNINKIYINKLKTIHKVKNNNYKILIDCSNGSSSNIAKLYCKNVENIKIINYRFDGSNTNYKCGALEPDILLKKVKKHNYDYGVAFDGDGDRAVFVSNEYGIIETEKLVYLFSHYNIVSGINKIIVSTEICNKGLEDNLYLEGYKLIQTEVGDRNVVNNTIFNKAIIGVEPSGHYFFPKLSKTMDGFIALLHFIKLLNVCNKNMTIELNKLKHYHRVSGNIPIGNIENFELNRCIKEIAKEINNQNEKLIIRKSMWDPVIRIYYDYSKYNNIEKIMNYISENLGSIENK